MPLYKFIEREFLDSFFTTGCLRLGTIYDFKDIVEHGISRGDHLEGQHGVKRSNNGTLELTKDKHEPIISEMFKMEGEGSATINGGTFVVTRKSPNGFIFCTSNQFTEKLFYDWEREEGLDACYEISNVKGFIQAINKAIASGAFFYMNSDVTYRDETIDYRSEHANINPAFTKFKDKYGWQCENRTVWGPKGPCYTLNPWIVHVPEAIKYCKPLAFIDNGTITYASV
ncbi:hypothetical protein AN392_00698 [Pseudoalteromonas sp. P1-16-1b]|uniref:hypothetical protein n=1 Tax=Pseudoalteromonas sp. P1-16-1b TaxID=1723757 RepID=UPI0006E6BCCA|nr:hypothetical protein [Pseudoalteromonas sp. P1-16-1b]KPZ66126.1 hypothetical protein AN392_00698 [Pseudoalteromonas sp. P1-16-1b]